MIDPDFDLFIQLYNDYKNGYLPTSESSINQSNAFTEAVNLIEALLNE